MSDWDAFLCQCFSALDCRLSDHQNELLRGFLSGEFLETPESLQEKLGIPEELVPFLYQRRNGVAHTLAHEHVARGLMRADISGAKSLLQSYKGPTSTLLKGRVTHMLGASYKPKAFHWMESRPSRIRARITAETGENFPYEFEQDEWSEIKAQDFHFEVAEGEVVALHPPAKVVDFEEPRILVREVGEVGVDLPPHAKVADMDGLRFDRNGDAWLHISGEEGDPKSWSDVLLRNGYECKISRQNGRLTATAGGNIYFPNLELPKDFPKTPPSLYNIPVKIAFIEGKATVVEAKVNDEWVRFETETDLTGLDYGYTWANVDGKDVRVFPSLKRLSTHPFILDVAALENGSIYRFDGKEHYTLQKTTQQGEVIGKDVVTTGDVSCTVYTVKTDDQLFEVSNTDIGTSGWLPRRGDKVAIEFCTGSKTVTDFKLGDGFHVHPNGGGVVADTASVSGDAFVSHHSRVWDRVVVEEGARLEDFTVVTGDTVVKSGAVLSGFTIANSQTIEESVHNETVEEPAKVEEVVTERSLASTLIGSAVSAVLERAHPAAGLLTEAGQDLAIDRAVTQTLEG